MAARINVLHGVHRLLLVVWTAWAMAVMGYVAWGWWTASMNHVSCEWPTAAVTVENCPWLFLLHTSKTLALYRATQYLVLGPGLVYMVVMTLTLSLRWVWRRLVADADN